jgi:hypothetical protein
MQFTNSLAYVNALARGVTIATAKFHKLAKMDEDTRIDNLQDIVAECCSMLKVSHFVSSKDELDEMEYEVHYTLVHDVNSWIVNEINELARINASSTIK